MKSSSFHLSFNDAEEVKVMLHFHGLIVLFLGPELAALSLGELMQLQEFNGEEKGIIEGLIRNRLNFNLVHLTKRARVMEITVLYLRSNRAHIHFWSSGANAQLERGLHHLQPPSKAYRQQSSKRSLEALKYHFLVEANPNTWM